VNLKESRDAKFITSTASVFSKKYAAQLRNAIGFA
jgi:hypothetical protein